VNVMYHVISVGGQHPRHLQMADSCHMQVTGQRATSPGAAIQCHRPGHCHSMGRQLPLPSLLEGWHKCQGTTSVVPKLVVAQRQTHVFSFIFLSLFIQ